VRVRRREERVSGAIGEHLGNVRAALEWSGTVNLSSRE
jgi:hypothetical protein